jgi:crossover junction endodeoxyribonuclease RuvC
MILGIDVGLTGAVAVLTEDGEAVEVWDLPTMGNGKQASRVKQQVNAGALSRRLRTFELDRTGALAYVEQQAARPKQGVAGMFSLGHSLGTVQAVLASLGLPFLMVQPREWKTWYKLQHADKDASRTLASRLFPTMELYLKKHHNRAEALLIAGYGVARARQQEAG